MSQLIIDALRAKVVSDRLKAVANLQTFLSTSVGIGEHPDIVTECYKLLEAISKSDGEIQSLNALIEAANKSQE
tara:strand:- start:7763 stop:7984 length:222 start_codon:yes stop_codon:yes gene_type:complete